jgi:hypothetical protein
MTAVAMCGHIVASIPLNCHHVTICVGMKSVGNGRTQNHKCRKTVRMERYFSTFMKVNYYKIMKNDIKIN